MSQNIVSQPTAEEIKAVKKMAGTIQSAARTIMDIGGSFGMFQRIVDDPIFRQDLVEFYNNYVPIFLNYNALLQWFQENKLEQYLTKGSLEKEIKAREMFFQYCYGQNFKLDRKKILIDSKRLTAIKVGLENRIVNTVLFEIMPEVLTAEEKTWTPAQFFFYRILKELEMKVWEETGKIRWTDKSLENLLAEGINVLPEDFRNFMLRNSWIEECLRVIKKKGPAQKVIPGSLSMSFVDGRVDVPVNQRYVNQSGKLMSVDDCSFITAVVQDIKLVTQSGKIVLAGQIFYESREYLGRDTWEVNSTLLEHGSANPSVSVVNVDSPYNIFQLDSDVADNLGGRGRFRISL
jgi:hypothetical protein